MHHYRKLTVWRKSHDLTLRVYRTAFGFRREQWPLAAQMRRAAHSIPSNIAEGSGRVTNPQFAQQLQIAIGSARELDYLLLLAADLGEVTSQQHATLEARTEEVTKMLVALRKTVVLRTKGGKENEKPRR